MIHEDAIDLVQFFEGCNNIAYACPAHISNGGKWPHLTLGYGHSGPDVMPGMRVTTAQARDLLARDLNNAERMAKDLVRVQLAPEQWGAVTSLAMNLKPGLFSRSRCLAMLNAGNAGHFDLASAYQPDFGRLTGMAREWAEFRGAEGVGKLNGLVKRRAAELELFFTGNWSVPKEDRMPQALVDPHGETPSLKPGERGEIISDLHEALGAVGYPVTCGDAYTWVTADAVRAFQASHGLKADGVYGPMTAAKLDEVLRARQS